MTSRTSACTTSITSDIPLASAFLPASSAMRAHPSTAITLRAPALAHSMARRPGPHPTSNTTLPAMCCGPSCFSAACHAP
eukprot:CAMPEP_0202874486 /NCGR_PEP_ID=MMETSP1391-20130828/25497_1 /ASSEMBLY_ACC=CAM_ASM_000867 /TAXON_ID=1034604 /ORGANISM="Chlamydomonas leiostraca, Strain SAG 11-49" /LENGTH=79 /DNA_ID=CAMNT_0049555931 /DNA_START=107 /DNA_END=343 /DNA_ORIENTATION=-